MKPLDSITERMFPTLAAYARTVRRREAIFERVLSGQLLRDADLTWLIEKQGMRRWERNGKQIL